MLEWRHGTRNEDVETLAVLLFVVDVGCGTNLYARRVYCILACNGGAYR
jgi:hypothetical protein